VYTLFAPYSSSYPFPSTSHPPPCNPPPPTPLPGRNHKSYKAVVFGTCLKQQLSLTNTIDVNRPMSFVSHDCIFNTVSMKTYLRNDKEHLCYKNSHHASQLCLLLS
jgi:hypothetical protein